MSKPLILPDSRLKTAFTVKDQRWNAQAGYWETPYYCASCHTGPCGWCPEDSPHLFYVCTECFNKKDIQKSLEADIYYMPDEIYFQEVQQAQEAKYGRVLTAEETVVKLADPDSLESLLVRSRDGLTPKVPE